MKIRVILFVLFLFSFFFSIFLYSTYQAQSPPNKIIQGALPVTTNKPNEVPSLTSVTTNKADEVPQLTLTTLPKALEGLKLTLTNICPNYNRQDFVEYARKENQYFSGKDNKALLEMTESTALLWIALKKYDDSTLDFFRDIAKGLKAAGKTELMSSLHFNRVLANANPDQKNYYISRIEALRKFSIRSADFFRTFYRSSPSNPSSLKEEYAKIQKQVETSIGITTTLIEARVDWEATLGYFENVKDREDAFASFFLEIDKVFPNRKLGGYELRKSLFNIRTGRNLRASAASNSEVLEDILLDEFKELR